MHGDCDQEEMSSGRSGRVKIDMICLRTGTHMFGKHHATDSHLSRHERSVLANADMSPHL